MKKQLISAAVSFAMLASSLVIPVTGASAAEAKVPQYQAKARQMEELDRGLIAAYRTADNKNVMSDEAGVYLSWRLLGDESLETQEYDIYKNGSKIATTTGAKSTNYIDRFGAKTDTYKVVKAGASEADVAKEKAVTPQTNHVGSGGSNLKESFVYEDILLERPADSNDGHYYTISKDVEGGANDASVGDLDRDGEYEIVLKWDPTNSKDASSGGTTGHTYLDGYEIDPTNTDPSKNANNHLYMWRIDLGPHVRSGAHENPFLVYDFDGDGKSEIASLSGPGAIDGTGKYVTEVGDTETIKKADNTLIQLRKGKNIGPEYYTIFDGETGKALWTTDAIPLGREDGGDWGDSKMQRSPRYLAAVAYLDGIHPSIVMCRGYYNRSVLRAYTWDGTEMALQWEYDSGQSGVKADSMYGQGNHNLSVGDIDNDGKDEIVYGSACLDHDGKTVMGNTLLGHGDAMHMKDFNNDGVQEVFSVKEKSEGFKKYAEDLRVAATGEHFWEQGKVVTSGDNGRGVMDNIDDAYALEQYKAGNKNVMALGWSSGLPNTHDFKGNDVNAKPGNAGKGTFDNFLVYWDGDLSRELLDANIIQKYDAKNGYTTRFWGEADGYTLTGAATNNYSKRNPSLVADIWGDWREEIIMPTGKGQDETPALRIFTSTIPTDYRLTTLMHDCQYRLAIAWQNIAYNQPPHTSYYVGSIALASDAAGNTKNYLAPAVPYTKVTYDAPEPIAVTGISLNQDSVKVEKGKTVSVNAVIEPEDATKKGIIWTTTDDKIATVTNGVVKGVGAGTATVTATTKDGGFSDTCTVEVYETPVTSVKLDEEVIELGINTSQKLTAEVYPDNATDKSVKWTSEDIGVASVAADGTVTGAGYGRTTIVATTNDGGKTAKCIVRVKPIEVGDATGEDNFVSSNTDAETKFTGTAVSGAATQTKATVPIEFHKDFEVFENNTASLAFHFTTGGAKESDYIWKLGHGYTSELKLLGSKGENILNIFEEHTTSGVSTKYISGTDEAKAASTWTKIAEGDDSPLNRSQIRWDVKVDFDYNSDTAVMTLSGCNKDWVKGETYQYTFNLNGSRFKTIQYNTKDITDYVSGSPKIEDVSYTYQTRVSGNAEELYERGAKTAWSDADKTDWVEPQGQEIHYAVDSENDRLVYDVKAPGAAYSAKKTFDNITSGAIVSYDVDWYFGSAINRDGNFEYIQFGDKLRLGWTNGYKVFISTDGGVTWLDSNGDGTSDSIFDGENKTYTKNVKAIFDTETKLVTLWFDNKEIGEYSYSYLDGNTADGANSFEFGFMRAGAAPEWATPNGIDRIRVSQFIEGEEAPDMNEIKTITVDETDAKKINVKYSLVDYDGDSVTLVGALYNADGTVKEVKSKDIASPQIGVFADDSLTFDNNIADYSLRVFMWNSLKDMVPVCSAKGEVSSAPAAKPTAKPTPKPTATVDPNATPKPTATPTPTPAPTATATPAPTATPSPVPTMNPDVEYTEVFTSADNFLMTDNAANKWIVSSDGLIASDAEVTGGSKTVTATEVSTDKGGNATAKLNLADKAVQYVLDDEIASGFFKLTYDMLIDKDVNTSGYGRYFRTYLDNAAHPFDAATGKASAFGNENAFFHMMDYNNVVYTTSSVALIAGGQNNDFSTGAIKLSETTLDSNKWYRVVIEGDIDNDIVNVKYYAHGDAYNESLDVSTATPVINNMGCFTDGRDRKIKQIKFMKTAGGSLYYDNIKFEKSIEPADATAAAKFTDVDTSGGGPAVMVVKSIGLGHDEDNGIDFYEITGDLGGSEVKVTTTKNTIFGDIQDPVMTKPADNVQFNAKELWQAPKPDGKKLTDFLREGDILLYSTDGNVLMRYASAKDAKFDANSNFIKTSIPLIGKVGNGKQWLSRVAYYFDKVTETGFEDQAYVKLEGVSENLLFNSDLTVTLVTINKDGSVKVEREGLATTEISVGDYLWINYADKQSSVKAIVVYRIAE